MSRLRLRGATVLSLVALACAACASREQKPPTSGELKDFAAVCDKANEDKRVAVAGYLRLPAEVNLKGIYVVLRLYQTNDASGNVIGVSSKIGIHPNEVDYMPKEYTDKDLKVHLATGPVAGFGTKVKVSGDMYYPSVKQEFPCALSNPLVELAN